MPCTSKVKQFSPRSSCFISIFQVYFINQSSTFKSALSFQAGEKKYQQKMYFRVYFWEHVGYLTSSSFVSSQFMYQPIMIAWVQTAAHISSLC